MYKLDQNLVSRTLTINSGTSPYEMGHTSLIPGLSYRIQTVGTGSPSFTECVSIRTKYHVN